MKLNPDRDWLLKKAEQEDNQIVSVGGLVCRIAMEANDVQEIPESTRRVAFSRFIEFSRRRLRLTVEQLAERADVDVAELVELEEGDSTSPEPRTIFKLSDALKVPQERLMVLSGLSRPRDQSLQAATVRFAARSEPVNVLSAEEEEALQEYVNVLVDSSNGG